MERLVILAMIIEVSLSTTSIKTFATLEMKENLPVGTSLLQLNQQNHHEKYYLLNLSGFERKYFRIEHDNLLIEKEVDREEFLQSKRCFDRSYCLIELHILVNDGQLYFVIPVHIVDVNDNRPEFKNRFIHLKLEENSSNEHQIPIEGAFDGDEGVNGAIVYELDCSLMNRNHETNCSNMFHLNILSRSQFVNQYDQLLLRFGSLGEEENVYKLRVNAFDCNPVEKCREGRRLNNSMIIEIQILNSNEEDIDFVKSKYEFIIEMETPLKKGANLGEVKTNSRKQTIFFKIDNEVIENNIKINEQTGELTLLNEEILFNKTLISFSIKLFDSAKQKYLLRKTTIVFIYFRFQNQLKSISFSYFNQSSLIQRQNENHFFISSKSSIPSDEILFSVEILPSYYLFDQYFLYLDNTQTQFSLIFERKNVYSLKLLQPSLSNNLFLQFSIEHQLTKEFLSSPLIIQFQFVSNQENLCQENLFYEAFDLSTENSIGKLQVTKTTNETISSFSTFHISDENPNEIFIDQCQMNFTQLNSSLLLTQFRLCSSSLFSPSCFSIEKNISSSNELLRLEQRNSSIMKIFLALTPIEIIFLSFGCVFILLIIMILTIICRLKGRRVCLEIKNYLFYGKKYGLSHAQSLSNAKMNQRVHSIVIRESLSPSIESIKEKIHFDGVSREESSSQLNDSNDLKSISDRDIPNRILQETNPPFDLLVSNENLHTSRLASEV